jgi:hypothetical protein
MKSWIQTVHRFQTYFNPKGTVPPDWETAWLDGADALYKLTEGNDAHFPERFMVRDVLMISQVRHATKYTTPAAIAAHIPELAEEALDLRTRCEFDIAVTDEYFRVLSLGKPKGELEELAEELTEEQLEKQRAEETEINVERAAAWQEWMEQNNANIRITA